MSGTLQQETWAWFLERVAGVRESPAFEDHRSRRLELATALRGLLDDARDGSALEPALDRLLSLPPGWGWAAPLPDWIRAWATADEESLRKGLLVFAAAEGLSPQGRFEHFAAIEQTAREAHERDSRPLLVLVSGSMLNFALEPESLPVVWRVFQVLERALGYDPKTTAQPGERYAHHLAFARHVRTGIERASIPVRDMIDVEGYMSLSLGERDPNMPRLPRTDTIPLLRDRAWIMSLGERAAFEGVLSQLQPALALEIGAGRGGGLRRLAAHSGEVHEIDLADRPAYVDELDNVHWHKGDSRAVLAPLLARFADQGRNVDFVHVDGDHSTEGVRRDMEDLLASPAVGRTIILAHDTMNEAVRRGLEQIDYEQIPKVGFVELDFVSGYMFREPSLRYQLWSGIGLIVVDADAPGPVVRQDRFYDMHALISEMKRALMQREASGEIPE